jgi:DNA repair photolyase
MRIRSGLLGIAETPAQVRVLTKSHHVQDDFELIRKHRDRIIVGLSTGAPASREHVAQVTEPNASSVSERLTTLQLARKMGLRTFGMICPVLPGIGDSRGALEETFGAVLKCQPETIWLEPVNSRGNGLLKTSAALRLAGYRDEAASVNHIRKRENWSSYTTALVKEAIDVARSKRVLDRLKVLLYPDGLLPEHRAELEKYDQGIVWLNPDRSTVNSASETPAAEEQGQYGAGESLSHAEQ